ncbi:MAG TPA: dihydroorotate dehydrogenase-like protein [Polyangiaceae bacterium]|nr:dihydroorotate dehydrogenase-like protein [Polyangiaceae bacterium]
MDLTTRYLGLTLPHPLVLGASPLVDDLGAVRRAEDLGAAAIVMHSLFEEQISHERHARAELARHEESFAEALYFAPHRAEFHLGPHEYLEQIRRIKDAVAIPIVASLNGTTNTGWLEYAKLIDQAGADALELNAYRVATDPEESGDSVEKTTADMLATVKAQTRLPVAVKLSPYHTSLAHFARRLASAHADGLVLFNRFYQPDLDLEALEVAHRLELSTSADLLLRLRWLAVLSAQVDVSFAVSGGVHSVEDVVKVIMTGADAVQLVSEILQHGLHRFTELRGELERWLEAHEYHSLAQARRSMNLANCPDPKVYERTSYLRILNSWPPPESRAR